MAVLSGFYCERICAKALFFYPARDTMSGCELCHTAGGNLLWRNDLCRVVLVEGVESLHYPGFCRVILNSHVSEMSELALDMQLQLMQIVVAVEQVIRQCCRPTKVNLASLGNQVPHLHWHVIPRWESDRCFPNPIWGAVRQESQAGFVAAPDVTVMVNLLQELLREHES